MILGELFLGTQGVLQRGLTYSIYPLLRGFTVVSYFQLLSLLCAIIARLVHYINSTSNQICWGILSPCSLIFVG